jgi:hypothetical protein
MHHPKLVIEMEMQLGRTMALARCQFDALPDNPTVMIALIGSRFRIRPFQISALCPNAASPTVAWEMAAEVELGRLELNELSPASS